MRYNNPVEVADTERKLLWPHLARDHPALLLSIGTGFDSASKVGEDKQGPKIIPGVSGYSKRLIKMAQDQFETCLDCELAWKKFLEPLKLTGQDSVRKYRRLNFDYGDALPKIDDVNSMASLVDRTRMHFSQDPLIGEVADTLTASLFYFRVDFLKADGEDGAKWNCEGRFD